MDISGLGYRNYYQNSVIGRRQGRNVRFQGFMEQHNVSKTSETSRVSDYKDINYDKPVSASYTKVSGENHYTDQNTGETVYSGYNGYTFYTKEGIFYMQSRCDTKSMEYTDTVEWTVKFNSDKDYDRAMDFMSKFPESDSKRFAANEQFWNDFVDGKIDEDDFMKFYNTLDYGIARCVKTDENGNDRIDMEMTRSKYFNYFSGSEFKPLTYEQLVEKFLQGARIGESPEEKSPQNVLSNFFKDADKRMFSFINEEMEYGLNDWISEMVSRVRGGLLEKIDHSFAEYKSNVEDTYDNDEDWAKTISCCYAAESTKNDPVVEVSVTRHGETFSERVHINDVNPGKCTQQEIKAYLYHYDETNGTQGSYETLMAYAETAQKMGYWDGNDSFDEFANDTYSWKSMFEEVWKGEAHLGLSISKFIFSDHTFNMVLSRIGEQIKADGSYNDIDAAWKSALKVIDEMSAGIENFYGETLGSDEGTQMNIYGMKKLYDSIVEKIKNKIMYDGKLI